jgi:hypothetical protein
LSTPIRTATPTIRIAPAFRATASSRQTKSLTIPVSCIGHDLVVVTPESADLGDDAIRNFGGRNRHF